MNENLLSLLKNLNIKIISQWTIKEYCLFLFCVHISGSLFFINVKGYELTLDDDDLYSSSRYFTRKISEDEIEDENVFIKYQQICSLFQRFSANSIFLIRNIFFLNTNNIYQILNEKSPLTNCNGIFPIFDLSLIYKQNYEFEELIISLKSEILKKVETISDSKIEHTLDFPITIFESSLSMIYASNEEFGKTKNLYYSISIYIVQLTKQKKSLENYSDVKTVYETKQKIREKIKVKHKINNLIDLRNKLEEKLMQLFLKLINNIFNYIYYKQDTEKKYISIQSSIREYESMIR